MSPRLEAGYWLNRSDSGECEAIVRDRFGPEYSFLKWQQTVARAQVAVLHDARFGLEWVLAPGGTFNLGLTDGERAAALKLSPRPLLNFEEMQPVLVHVVEPFLILQSPVSQDFARRLGLEVEDMVGPRATALVDEAHAIQIASLCDSALPTEVEWEYACRAGAETLFWLGNDVPPSRSLPSFLGLEDPAIANRFGLGSLFFGEWCADQWRRDHRRESPPDPSAGRVIKGGAARFWPWQDDREWSGCVSAFRMPAKDTGGAGVALRLLRRPN